MSDVSSTLESQSRATVHEQGAESHQDRGEEIEMTVIRQDVAGLKEKEAAIEREAQNSNTSNNVQIEAGYRSLTNGRNKFIKKGKACCKNFNWRRLELITMIVTAVVVCGLLTLPTIFYHIPRSQSSEQVGHRYMSYSVGLREFALPAPTCMQNNTACMQSVLVCHKLTSGSKQFCIPRTCFVMLG